MRHNPIHFYLVRHGQTWSNLRHMMIGGGGSAPLTPTGRQAASHLGLGLRKTAFTAAYASPLGRAMETASHILRHLPNPPALKEMPGLKDVFWGDLEAGIPDDVRALKRDKYADDPLFPLGRLDAPDYRSAYGGETICDFVRRFEQALQTIAANHPEGGNILAVSHAALGSFLAKYGADIGNMDTANISTLPEVANTSVSVVVFEDGAFRAQSVNDLSFIRAGESLAAEKTPVRLHIFSDPETTYEAKGVLLGCSDATLSERAIHHAAQLREQYQTQRFTAVYCSPLGRARELCRLILGPGAGESSISEDLREISLTRWEAEKAVVLAERFPIEYQALSAGGDPLLRYLSPVGGEHGAAAAARLDGQLRKIAERHEFSGGSIAVFTHRITLRAWLALRGYEQNVKPGTVLRFSYQKDEFIPE